METTQRGRMPKSAMFTYFSDLLQTFDKISLHSLSQHVYVVLGLGIVYILRRIGSVEIPLNVRVGVYFPLVKKDQMD